MLLELTASLPQVKGILTVTRYYGSGFFLLPSLLPRISFSFGENLPQVEISSPARPEIRCCSSILKTPYISAALAGVKIPAVAHPLFKILWGGKLSHTKLDLSPLTLLLSLNTSASLCPRTERTFAEGPWAKSRGLRLYLYTNRNKGSKVLHFLQMPPRLHAVREYADLSLHQPGFREQTLAIPEQLSCEAAPCSASLGAFLLTASPSGEVHQHLPLAAPPSTSTVAGSPH